MAYRGNCLRREAKNEKLIELLHIKVYPFTLTRCILVDSPIVICWTGPFVILGVSGRGVMTHGYIDAS